MYHGPREQVVPFFESLGFRCPERKGIPDFLQEVTSRKDQKVRLKLVLTAEKPHEILRKCDLTSVLCLLFVGSFHVACGLLELKWSSNAPVFADADWIRWAWQGCFKCRVRGLMLLLKSIFFTREI